MDRLQHVALHYVPSDGRSWAEYISAKLKAYSIDCDLCDFTGKPGHRVQTSKVNVIFVTPDLLECSNWDVLHNVKDSSCLMVLTGTETNDLAHVLNKKVPNFHDFEIHEMEATEESVQELLVLIISEYEEGEMLGQHKVASAPSNLCEYGGREDQDDVTYHTLPPARQVNSLQDVLYKDGLMYILLLRRAEGQVTVQINNKTVSPNCMDYGVYQVQYEGDESTDVSVLHDGKVIGKSFLTISQDTGSDTSRDKSPGTSTHVRASCTERLLRTVTVETQTDFCLETVSSKPAKLPRDSTYENLQGFALDNDVFEKSSPLSKTENKLDTLRAILEDETDPEGILCQCLGIEKGIKELDDEMTSMVQRLTSLRRLSYSNRQFRTDKDKSTWPTLVHFAAQYNLQNLCDVLLSNPLMWDACVITNKDGKMPHEIAESEGHTDLKIMLKRFTEFVKKERERDSGISGLSGSTRMSISSMLGDPPAPHRPVDSSGYVVFDPDEELSESVVNSCPLYIDMTGHRRSIDDHDRQTIIAPDTEESEPVAEHHMKKDIEKLLGATERELYAQTSPPTEESKKKRGSKSKLALMFTKKGRSKSEPLVGEEILTLRTKKTQAYSTGEPYRPSSSSSSTASTISESSLGRDESLEVKSRKKKLANLFGKKKKFANEAKRRESIRIKHVMDDRHGGLPPLPSRLESQPHIVISDYPNEQF